MLQNNSNSQGKIAIVVILFIVLVAVGSFYIGKYTQKSDIVIASPDPSSVEVINNIPTPASSASESSISNNQTLKATPKPDVEISQDSNSKIYINNKRGFSFNFANSLTLNNSVSDEKFAQFLEFQSGTGNVTRMVMQIFDNPQNSSLEEVIKREELLRGDALGPKYEYFKVEGKDAVKLTKTMTQNEICNDGDGSTKNRVFYFLVKGDGYVVEIHPNDSCESFKRNWFDITPSSFQFN